MAQVRLRVPAATEENVHWVRHELTDAGWRWRTVLRHLVVILPVCAAVVVVLEEFLPAPPWVSAMMVDPHPAGSVLTVATYADDIRAARLRQHGLPVPADPDLGRPAH